MNKVNLKFKNKIDKKIESTIMTGFMFVYQKSKVISASRVSTTYILYIPTFTPGKKIY